MESYSCERRFQITRERVSMEQQEKSQSRPGVPTMEAQSLIRNFLKKQVMVWCDYRSLYHLLILV
ncbi:hypothetical protein PISMIDRAFT_329024 [Pisolithus microcarpus 441]|uniref:Uncharacterized protein n=1 Tax=Pisolithus microcarpus 441 TaxID=765257 RepID=A0A0C9Z5L1_9AGAM|nr:hypothetical protein PISMIDRAFT_329024 [Pisolithus microcarpus 441]